MQRSPYNSSAHTLTTTETAPTVLNENGVEIQPEIQTTTNALGLVTEVRDARGSVTNYEYDWAGRMITVQLPEVPDPDNGGLAARSTTRITYDPLGRTKTFSAGHGVDMHTTTYVYDYWGRDVTATLPDVDGEGGQSPSSVDWRYDSLGNLTSYAKPYGGGDGTGIVYYSYDEIGRPVLLNYDHDHEPQTEGIHAGAIYDAAGNLVKEIDLKENVTTYFYDSRNRLKHVIEPDPDGPEGSQLSAEYCYTYDDNGNLTGSFQKLPEAAGVRWIGTTYAYNALDQLTGVTEGVSATDSSDADDLPDIIGTSGPTTAYHFDDYTDTLTVTDPLNNVTTLVYDALGRLIQETNQLGQSRYYRYDAAGNLRKYTDRNNRETTYWYDALNRLEQEAFPSESTISFQYDVSGTLHAATNDAAQYIYWYDPLNRVTDTSATICGLLPTVKLHEEYNRWNARTLLSATLLLQEGTPPATPDFENIYNYHDALGYLESIEQKGQAGGNTVIDKLVSFANDILGRWHTITCEVLDSGSGYADTYGWVKAAHTAREFDNASRVKEIRHYQSTGDGESAITRNYNYDQANRLKELTNPGGIPIVTYAYDDASQLTGVDYAARGMTHADAAILYDDAGNRDTLVSTVYPNPSTPIATTYDHQASADNRLTSDGTYRYEYDAEGNRTMRYVWTDTNGNSVVDSGERSQITAYQWDHRNRLVSVTERPSEGATPTKVVENSYDAFDRRVGKKVTESGESDRYERYVYDGSNMILAFEGLTSTLTGTDLGHRYLWGEAVDQLLADENLDLGLCYFPQADQQGSIIGAGGYSPACDQFGGYFADYDAFGNCLGATGTSIRFRYTGQEWDADVGLYYYNARWYDPHTSQFLSQDPIGFAGGDTNLYRYVGNNATNLTDPSGADWFDQVDRVYAGFADVMTFGLTTRLRTAFYGGLATRNHEGSAFAAGQGVGLATSMALGGYAAMGNAGRAATAGARTATWGTRAAQEWLVAGTAYSGAQAMHNLAEGKLGAADALALAPFVSSRALSFRGFRRASPRGPAGSVRVTDNACVPREYAAPARNVGEAPANVSRQTFATGSEWYDYFAGKYGAQNVDWVSGSGRTVTWPSELPMPQATQMFKVPTGPRSSTFLSKLESVAGPRPAGGIGHHVQPFSLQGVDNGAVNGAWVLDPAHTTGHARFPLNQIPYGTEIRIKPPR